MATAGQTDPRVELLDHLTGQVTFDAEALTFLRRRLDQVDLAVLQAPAQMQRARESMGKLAGHSGSQSLRSGPVRIDAMQMALRDLCPLFPIC